MYNEETTSTKDEALKPDLFMQDFKFYKKLQTIDFSRPIESILYLDKINEEALKKEQIGGDIYGICTDYVDEVKGRLINA